MTTKSPKSIQTKKANSCLPNHPNQHGRGRLKRGYPKLSHSATAPRIAPFNLVSRRSQLQKKGCPAPPSAKSQSVSFPCPRKGSWTLKIRNPSSLFRRPTQRQSTMNSAISCSDPRRAKRLPARTPKDHSKLKSFSHTQGFSQMKASQSPKCRQFHLLGKKI